jgi:predicted ATP-grasp superfamily ATP-dependent carboligase
VIELEGVPELADPVLVAAFEGWNDAGDAASAVVQHLHTVWNATAIGEMDPEDYYDYQVNRPIVSLEGGVRRITWPTTRVSYARLPEGRDIVLVRGIEPNIRWRAYCAEFLGLCHELGVSMVVSLGALLAEVPHTRPVPVSAYSSDDGLVRSLGLEKSEYEGPTGIVGVVQEACTRAGLPAASIWARVPHYVANAPNPKGTLAVLRRLEDLLDLSVPLGDLPEEARAWQRGVDELAEDDTEVAEYVRSLEEAKDTTELPEASGEAIAREFERYLRRRHTDPPEGGPSR